MADTGGDITEIKDKIKQLTSLASQQNGKVEGLSKNVFNLSVSMGNLPLLRVLDRASSDPDLTLSWLELSKGSTISSWKTWKVTDLSIYFPGLENNTGRIYLVVR